MRNVGYFVTEGLTKKEAEELKKEMTEIKDLITTKNLRLEALISIALEKESTTQDKYDELLNLIKSFGKQKGFKVD